MSAAAASSSDEEAGLNMPVAGPGRMGMRRSAIAVVSGFGAFVALQLGLAAVLEMSLPDIRDPIYVARLAGVQKSLRAKPMKPYTVVMIGSSRVLQGFRIRKDQEKVWSDAIGHPVAAFNFGISGTSSLTELLNWGRLRRARVRPDLLLVEVLPPLLSEQFPPGDYSEALLPVNRLSWEDLRLVERYAGNTRASLRRDWLAFWPMPWYSDRLGLTSFVAPGLLPPACRVNPEEISGPVPPKQRLRATQIASDDYHSRFGVFHLGGPQCQALRELLVSCRTERVSVALVLMPEGPTFRSWYPPGTWETINDWLTQVSCEYDAPLINAREWINDEEDFLDSHHLLRSGGDKFTERLARDYILPFLCGQSGKGNSQCELAARPTSLQTIGGQ